MRDAHAHAWLFMALLCLGLGCDRIQQRLIDAATDGEPAAAPPPGSDLQSLDEGEVTRVYYQFTDDANRVRFVTSLDLVPEEWRDRMGHVEMSVPPPMSPQDMKRAIAAKQVRVAERRQKRQRGPEIVIYSADWCPACRTAKRYMDKQGIAYEERNVDQPEYKKQLVEISGGRSIPVIDVDGAIMKGFNAERLDQLIAEAS